MKSNEIRSKFLAFYAGKGHTVVASSPLVPANDPDSTGAAFAAQQMTGGSAEFMLPGVAMSFTGLYQAAGAQTAAPVAAPPTVTAADPRPSDQEFTSFFNRLVLP